MFLSLSCQHLGKLLQWLSEEVLDRLCHLSSVDLSNTRELMNQLARNTCSSHRTKATIKYCDKYRATILLIRLQCRRIPAFPICSIIVVIFSYKFLTLSITIITRQM